MVSVLQPGPGTYQSDSQISESEEVGGLCDVWVMVFSSVVEWEGLDEEGDSNIDMVIHPCTPQCLILLATSGLSLLCVTTNYLSNY